MPLNLKQQILVVLAGSSDQVYIEDLAEALGKPVKSVKQALAYAVKNDLVRQVRGAPGPGPVDCCRLTATGHAAATKLMRLPGSTRSLIPIVAHGDPVGSADRPSAGAAVVKQLDSNPAERVVGHVPAERQLGSDDDGREISVAVDLDADGAIRNLRVCGQILQPAEARRLLGLMFAALDEGGA